MSANRISQRIAAIAESATLKVDAKAKALKAEGRNDVTFMVEGHGEESGAMPFDNKYPEERFYNRTVFIDILPGK
jgi:hypothetical protein